MVLNERRRRAVILRRAAKSDVALTRNSAEGQMELLLPDQDVELWEYAVLATNSFDELKNQWGWGGFTTQYIERCQTSARAVALSLAAVGRATKHAGKTTLYLTPMHAAKTTLMRLIANIRAALSHVMKVAEPYPAADRWKTLLDYIVARIIPRRPQKLLETCALLAR